MKNPKIAIKLSGDNNPMRQADVIAKRSGDNHPMKNPYHAKRCAEARKGPRPLQQGEKSPNYKPEIDKWIEENQGKHFCHCGCGGIIKIDRSCYPYVPDYIHGHNALTEESRNRHSALMKRYFQNKRWNKEVDTFIDGNPITDFIVRPANSYDIDPEEFNIWRLAVYRRDGYICQICGGSGCVIHAHHIIPQRVNRDLILDVDNGITLCRECHESTYNREELFVDELQMMVAGEI